ncbi:hypothetical protein GO755_39075 [Spirosoma sp. HMF4905]|uniref:Uncharacterized protein n=1 Tax=Spirosoma arboris TaxID=2682092 RepID=A0A7K1SQK7_9BACT|nr:hypothetical protein [Spirosoma arboris]
MGKQERLSNKEVLQMPYDEAMLAYGFQHHGARFAYEVNAVNNQPVKN